MRVVCPKCKNAIRVLDAGTPIAEFVKKKENLLMNECPDHHVFEQDLGAPSQ